MTRRSLSLFTFMAAAAIGCTEAGSPTPSNVKSPRVDAPVSGPAVARAGSVILTQAEVEAKLAAQSPTAQARYRELKYRREFVDSLIQFELLAQAGFERGLDQTPKLKDTIKKLVVQELIRDTFDEAHANYTEEELRAFYDRHVTDFVKPERVRVSHIFVAAAEGDAQARANAKKKASGLLAELKANFARAPATHPEHGKYVPTLFSKLASDQSDDQPTRPRGGDLAFLSHEDLTRAWSKEFADAVFTLKAPHDLTGVVETPKGYHIALFMSRMNAVNRAFDDPDVQKTVKGRLFRDQTQKSFDEYVEGLRKKAQITIDDEVLAAIDVPSSAAPARSPEVH